VGIAEPLATVSIQQANEKSAQDENPAKEVSGRANVGWGAKPVTEFKDRPKFSAKVPLCRLIERQSAKGTRFFSGFLGDAKIVMFEDKDYPPDKLYGGIGAWKLLLEEKPPKQD
jgi:hypothetical protein